MNIQVAVLCDAATDENWKLSLLGAFDTIHTPQLPAIHPQCAVALRMTFTSEDEGPRKFFLHFINADGRPIMPPIPMQVDVKLPEDVHFLTRNFIVHLQNLQFNEPGLYSVEIRMDEQSRASIPLLVKLVSPPGA